MVNFQHDHHTLRVDAQLDKYGPGHALLGCVKSETNEFNLGCLWRFK